MPDSLKRFLPAAIVVAAIFGFAGLFLLYKVVSAKAVGEPCQTNECNGPMGEYCVFDDRGGFCAPQCEGPGDCPEGWSCEHPTEVNQYGGRTQSSVQFCMRPGPEARVLREGSGTVTAVEGSLPGVSAGATCQWRQTSASPETGFDSRWQVRCGAHVLYGDGDSGYNPSQSPSWPAGAFVHDPNTTAQDGDPSLVFNAEGMTLRDDASGPHGAFTVQVRVP